MNQDTCLILDFGSQYTQLIARRVREKKFFSVIYPYNVSFQKIAELAPRAIILSGDGDFLPVLRYLRKQGKEVVIFPVGREPQGRYDNLQGVISGILNIWRQK